MANTDKINLGENVILDRAKHFNKKTNIMAIELKAIELADSFRTGEKGMKNKNSGTIYSSLAVSIIAKKYIKAANIRADTPDA